MKVSIVVTTYNRPDALEVVLNSIKKQTLKPYEVLIADDGSDHRTKQVIDKFIHNNEFKVIHSWHEDIGFRVSEARNKAISFSEADYLILIDGDMILNRFFIQDHLFHSERGFFIQGKRALLNEEETQNYLSFPMKTNFNFFSKGVMNRKNAIHSKFLSNFFVSKSNKLEGLKACNMSFFRDDFIRVNGFNHDFVGWGREDSELGVRMFNSGLMRKDIRYMALQLHLWHPQSTRKMLEKNNKILQESISNKKTWCNNGIDKYLLNY